jgi:ribosomal protein L11 methylase PrmA
VSAGREGSSFRDPDGFIFERGRVLYRQVNPSYRDDWQMLIDSGLYRDLTRDGLLVEHEEVDATLSPEPPAWKVLRPERVAFVSYPYEWSFSQLKAAALLTLRVQREAMKRGMSLKDASAYNVQLHEGRLLFIDTLSFERYEETRPWAAYGQFCRQFLAPLALVAKVDVRLGGLLRLHLDGVPLDLASRLLPARTRWSVGVGLHIHMHSRSRARPGDAPERVARAATGFDRRKLEALLASLETTVLALDWRPGGSDWSDYYDATHDYGAEGLEQKAALVRALVGELRPRTVWDLGANTGRFSRVAAEAGASTVVAWDVDPHCVEANYRELVRRSERAIVPLLLDLTNPSPALGWANAERKSLAERGPADALLALGLIHHLALANNVPLERIAEFLSGLGRSLIVEWVPKEDSQVQRMLATREDIFRTYEQCSFEKAFGNRFEISKEVPESGTSRTLYLMKTR